MKDVVIWLLLVAALMSISIMFIEITISIKRRECSLGLITLMGMVFFFAGAFMTALCGAEPRIILAFFAGGILCALLGIAIYRQKTKR